MSYEKECWKKHFASKQTEEKNRFQYEIIINTHIRTGKHIQTSIDV